MIRNPSMIERTAQAIVNGQSTSLAEEMALEGYPEFSEAVYRRVDQILNEKRRAKEEALQLAEEEKKDREIRSRIRAAMVIAETTEPEPTVLESRIDRGMILVVDDVPADLELMATYLTNAGFEVNTAMNLADALQVLHDQPIAVLVTDIVFPMYRLTTEEYKVWERQGTTRHSLLLRGISTECVEVTRKRQVKKDTKNFAEFAGFRLLDRARELLPEFCTE